MDNLEHVPLPLLEWFRDNARDLPWRHTTNPYEILLSEVMLQQTRVAAVLGYYTRFLEAAPTVEALALLEEDALMKLWQGLGYYSRARNLHKAAKVVVEEYGGVFPSHYQALRNLPGVGEYTAGAVASFAFGEAVPAVDGNVLRVVTRLNADPGDIGKPDTKRRITAQVRAVLPLHAPGPFNQAMMELGATVCLPNGAPQCIRCPVATWCKAYATGDFSFPKKAKKKARTVEHRQVWLLFYRGRVALRRRPETGLLAGLYEYPDRPEGVPHTPPEFAGTAVHIFTHKEWHMEAFAAQALTDKLPQGWLWAGSEEWRHRYSIPSAFAPFADFVGQRLD